MRGNLYIIMLLTTAQLFYSLPLYGQDILRPLAIEERASSVGGNEKLFTRRGVMATAASAIAGAFIGGKIAEFSTDSLLPENLADRMQPQVTMLQQAEMAVQRLSPGLTLGGGNRGWADDICALGMGEPRLKILSKRDMEFDIYNEPGGAWCLITVPSESRAVFYVPLHNRRYWEELTTEHFDLLLIKFASIKDKYFSNIKEIRIRVITDEPISDPTLGVLTWSSSSDKFHPGTNPLGILLVENVQKTFGSIKGLLVEIEPQVPNVSIKFGFQTQAARTHWYAKSQSHWGVMGGLGRLLGGIAGALTGGIIAYKLSTQYGTTRALEAAL